MFAVQLMVDMKWVLRAYMHHGLQDLAAASSWGTDTVRQYFRESMNILGRREKLLVLFTTLYVHGDYQAENHANLAVYNLDVVIIPAATKVGKRNSVALICEQ